MKLFCKKAVVFLLVALMLTTTCFSGVLAEEIAVESVAAKLETLPEIESFTASTDEGFEQAIDDALLVIEEMATLSDDDFYSLENSAKAFDLYVGLSYMKLKEGLPTTIPANFEEFMEQYENFYVLYQSEFELLSLLTEYTSLQEGEDMEYPLTLGDAMESEYSNELMEVVVRLAAAATTFTEEEQAAIELQTLLWQLEEFPESFTVENFWDYAILFESYLEGVSLENVPEAEAQKLQALQTSYDYLVMDERFALTDELDKRIAAVCDVEAVLSASELGRLYFHQIPCDEIGYYIDYAGMLYEEDASSFLTNYGLYEEYATAVYAGESDDFEGFFGDLNGDWFVDAKDALIVLKMAVGKMEMTDDDLWYGDVDGNGELDAKDALNILKYAVGKIEYFPVEEYLYIG